MKTLADLDASIPANGAHDSSALESALVSLAALATDVDPALALLLRVLADEPEEVAGAWRVALLDLAQKLHPDTDGSAIARLAARAMTGWDVR
jgi:hypothetical protein